MPSPVPESGSTNVDRTQTYKDDKIGSSKDSGNQQLTNTNQQNSQITSGNNDIWSGLNLDQLRLEWSGTDPSSKEYTISTYLPSGLNPSDLNINVDPRTRMLSLSCQKRNHQESKDEQGTYFYSEDSAAQTQRAFTLPDDVDIDNIKATKNTTGGFLLHLPKRSGQQLESQGVKQITIQ